MSHPLTRSRAALVLVILGLLVVSLVVVGTLIERSSGASRDDSGSSDDAPVAPAVAGQAGACDGRPAEAPREVRGMWLTTVYNIDWPSRPGLDEATVKAEFRGWLDVAERQHHNVIYVHIRPSGDAFWPSEYAPWSEWLTGKRDGQSPGWDPLEWMIAETHARGIDFHAWFNPYRGGQPGPNGPGGDYKKLAPNHPLRAHREWAVVYPKGTKASRFYFDPGLPEARRFVEDSMLEAVRKYDLDGVDFDDFFYPYPEAGQDFGDERSFATYGKGFASKADWRRHNVNTLIREMSERIKEIKPWVSFGISTFGIWRNSSTDRSGSATHGLQSYDEIYADSRTWVKERWIDSITPQLYWTIGNKPADYAVLVKWWSELVAGTGVQLYIAQGDYRVGEAGPWRDPGELDRQMAMNQRYNVVGTVHYSAKSVRANKLGAIARYQKKYYATPALKPPMPKLAAAPPAPPALMSVRSNPDRTVTVTWRPGADTAAYAVYRLDGGAKSARLVGTVRTGQSFVDSAPGADAAYCVAGLDRMANQGQLSAPMRAP